MNKQSWLLEDADAIAAKNRYTFYKPAHELIQRIAPGELVKLIFRLCNDDPALPRAERMWVKVEEIDGQGGFKGRLVNLPRHISDLALDDSIDFKACHIIDTEHDDEDNLVERYIKRCFVTNRVLDEGAAIGYLYREEPDDDTDSGWRITANEETDDYMDDPNNIAYVSLGAVLSCDDSILSLLESPTGSAFVRDGTSGRFVSVTD